MTLDDGRTIVSMPYTQQLNDKSAIERRFVSAEGFQQMICDQFDVLYKEGAKSGRVMAIALHPYLIGVPHRIGAFDAALKYICKHKKVWKATGSEIARHYLAQMDGGMAERRHRPRSGVGRTAMKLCSRCCGGAAALSGAAGAAGCARRRQRVGRHRRLGVGEPLAGLYRHQEGLLRRPRHLKVDIIYVQSSANLVQQLAAGSLDITMSTGLVDPIRAIDQGRADLDRAASRCRRRPMRWWPSPRSRSMKDLKGKVISLGGPKDITRIYVERMLAPHGVKPGEFDMVFAGATSARAVGAAGGRGRCRDPAAAVQFPGRGRRASTISA